MTSPRRALIAGPALAAVALALSACSSAEPQERSPEDVLAAAKTTLDETPGVRLRLETERLPATVNGILSAVGVGTHDPAFEGDLKVSIGGVAADVPVVAAQGKVMAKLPFTQQFSEVDPADYGAPDPAGLMEPEGGLSSLLTAAEDATAGEEVRSGQDVLSTYTGSVPGDVVADIIPSATAESDFDAEFSVDDEDRLRETTLTGAFYPGGEDVTYTITFEEYDVTEDIALP